MNGRLGVLILSITVFSLLTCTKGPSRKPGTSEQAVTPPVQEAGLKKLGAPITAGDTVALGKIVERPDEYMGKTVIIEGKVRAQCPTKGCWIELAESMEKSTHSLWVTFKDSAFAVPRGTVGAAARVQGVVVYHTLPKEKVSHIEAKGVTRFPNKLPDGGVRLIGLEATGVELRR